MSDYAKREDRAIDALVTGIMSPIYYVMAVLIYGWQGWAGVAAMSLGSVFYGLGSIGWFMWPERKAVAR
jgi:hypothetical protein